MAMTRRYILNRPRTAPPQPEEPITDPTPDKTDDSDDEEVDIEQVTWRSDPTPEVARAVAKDITQQGFTPKVLAWATEIQGESRAVRYLTPDGIERHLPLES